jgi:hypothetical protein
MTKEAVKVFLSALIDALDQSDLSPDLALEALIKSSSFFENLAALTKLSLCE